MTNGVPVLNFISWPFESMSRPFYASNTNAGLDVDLLIDKILANDKFNELVTASSTDSDKLMYFAKAKLETMEKELKATNDALVQEMNDKINKAKAATESLKEVDDYDEIRLQLETLKKAIESKSESSGEIELLKAKIEDLLQKHDELAIQLANCQKNGQIDRVQLEQELITALKEALISPSHNLMTREEFTTKMAETQHDLMYGLESKVLDKVRSDPVIMEKMSVLAHQTGQQFSKDDVVNIVHEALTVYDADKTGLFDFALESAGGTIASTRCTETYDVTQVNYV